MRASKTTNDSCSNVSYELKKSPMIIMLMLQGRFDGHILHKIGFG